MLNFVKERERERPILYVYACMQVYVCACARKSCLGMCLCFFLVGLSANGVKTDVQHKYLSDRDAVPPTSTCCCPLLQENCRQESPGVALNRQPLFQMLLDCMDCFRIKISEVVFPVGCSTVICSAAIFSWAITVLWLCLWMKVRLLQVVFLGMIPSSNRFNEWPAVWMVNSTASRRSGLFQVPSLTVWLTRYSSPVCRPWSSASTILFLELPSMFLLR